MHQSIGTPLVVAIHKISSFHCFVHPSWSLKSPIYAAEIRVFGLGPLLLEIAILVDPPFVFGQWLTYFQAFPPPKTRPIFCRAKLWPNKTASCKYLEAAGFTAPPEMRGSWTNQNIIGAWHQRIFRCYMVLPATHEGFTISLKEVFYQQKWLLFNESRWWFQHQKWRRKEPRNGALTSRNVSTWWWYQQNGVPMGHNWLAIFGPQCMNHTEDAQMDRIPENKLDSCWWQSDCKQTEH